MPIAPSVLHLQAATLPKNARLFGSKKQSPQVASEAPEHEPEPHLAALQHNRARCRLKNIFRVPPHRQPIPSCTPKSAPSTAAAATPCSTSASSASTTAAAVRSALVEHNHVSDRRRREHAPPPDGRDAANRKQVDERNVVRGHAKRWQCGDADVAVLDAEHASELKERVRAGATTTAAAAEPADLSAAACHCREAAASAAGRIGVTPTPVAIVA